MINKKVFKYIGLVVCTLSVAFVTVVGYKYYNYKSYKDKSHNYASSRIAEADERIEFNYIFFPDIKKESKEISFYFPENIGDLTLTKATLLQDENIVYEEVAIIKEKTMDNMVSVLLNHHISSFNKVKFVEDNGKEVTLDVGQFYLEKITFPFEIIESNLAEFVGSHNSTDQNTFYSEPILFLEEESNMYAIVPDKLKDDGYTDELVIMKSKNKEYTYTYSSSIPMEFFINNRLKNVTFELLWVQELVSTGDKHIILKEYIPLDVQY